MGECVEIGSAYSVMHPKPLLSKGFEAGAASLALRAQGVGSLEIEATAVDGKPVVCGDRLVSCGEDVGGSSGTQSDEGCVHHVQ